MQRGMEQLRLWAACVLAAAALCYAAGFLTVNLHLAKYAAQPPDLIHGHYVLAGIPVGLILCFAVVAVTWMLRCTDRQSAPPPTPASEQSSGGNDSAGPSGMSPSLLLLAVTLAIALAAAWGTFRIAVSLKGGMTTGGRLGLMAMVFAIGALALIPLQHCVARKRGWVRPYSRGAAAALMVVVAAGMTLLHTLWASPQLPQRWGGMRPTVARLWSHAPAWPTALLPPADEEPPTAPDDRASHPTRAVLLLFRGRTEWAVIPEDALETARPRAILVPAGAVSAVEIL